MKWKESYVSPTMKRHKQAKEMEIFTMSHALAFNAKQTKNRDYAVVFFGSILLYLISFIKIPLFFTPIPLVLRDTAALALGVWLGSKRGLAAVGLYLLYRGFFPMGDGGFSLFANPYAAGYLVGYCLGAYVTGKIVESKPGRLFSGILAGHMTVLLSGWSFLALFVGWKQAFCLGVVPFIGVAVLKATALAVIFKKTVLKPR